MIISASRRTDIPAFYPQWFINRIRAGYCGVPNPYNSQQVAYISLAPQDVDVIVFWTRNPRPLFPYLDELDRLGYCYYFQFTLLDYLRQIDAHTPVSSMSITTFRELTNRVGPERVIWRYDPIVFSELTPPEFHRRSYSRLARALCGASKRSVISVMDVYAKAQARLQLMAEEGATLRSKQDYPPEEFDQLMHTMAKSAAANGMEVFSCAEELNLRGYGILPGKCVDDDYIEQVFGLNVIHTKDPNQRKFCGCVLSKDIGMYDSCLFGCSYCYATMDFKRSKERHAQHDPNSPSLIGWHEPAQRPLF